MEKYKIYPLMLYEKLILNNEDEFKNINSFFKTTKIDKKINKVCVWVLGKEKDNGFGVILPVGVPYTISLLTGNHTSYGQNIEGIFDFEINTDNLYGKRCKLSDWLNTKKMNPTTLVNLNNLKII